MNSAAIPSSLQSNATVQASAGSGKTYLLVSRLIRLLLLGTRPEAILAITFTRKAAAEMQARLLQRIFEFAAQDDAQLDLSLQTLELAPQTPALRQRARNLYEQLLYNPQPIRATTFHAFCQDILRRFPLEANVPAGFELLERSGALQEQAWNNLMVQAAKDPATPSAQALSSLFAQLGLHNSRVALDAFLQQRSDWWAYSQGESDPVHYAQQRLQRQLAVDADAHPLSTFFTSTAHRAALDEFCHLLDRHPIKKNQQAVENISRSLASSEADETDFSLLWDAFFTRSGSPRARTGNKTQQQKMGEQGEARMLQLHQQMCEQLQQLHDALAARHTLRINSDWYQAGDHYLRLYQRIKSEQRLLDFADLEWKTFALLNHADNALWVQYKLDARIEHLLIDEFQDTNPTQWQLVKPLLEEMAQNPHDGQRSVFLVGDAKQSIYRFRRAEPRLFGSATQWLTEHLQATTFPLNKSWRSAPAVIDFVNQVFDETGALYPLLENFQPHAVHHSHRWGQVTLLPLTREPPPDADGEADETEITLRNPLLTPRTERINQRFLLEGRQIAETIRQLRQQPVILGDPADARALQYQDILILFRNRSHISAYEQALREADIPYLGAERGSLLDSLEVSDMVNLLQWLTLPHDNLGLAGILKSPLFGASDDDLIRLAQSNSPPGKSAWFERLTSLAPPAEPGSPLARAANLLPQWQQRCGHIPVHDLLDHIFSSANLPARFAAAVPPHQQARVKANLTRFIELALEMDSGRYPSLMRFLHWLKELRQQRDAPDEPVSGAASNRVQLMTIHAAKGLEAPVVFLADASSQSPKREAWSVQLRWPLEAQRPEILMLTADAGRQDKTSRELLQQQQQANRCEETNLLYVALTRSAQLLYISGSVPTRGKELGWYGDIAARFELDPLTLASSRVLTESASAPQAKTVAAPPEEETIIPDARLRHPITLPRQYREIAPSLEHAHSLATAQHQDADACLRGIVIHQMLDQLSRNPQATLDDLRLPTEAQISQPDLLSWWQQAQAVVQNPVFQHLFSAQYFQQAMNEVPILYQHQGVTVHGTIDRLIVSDTEALVLDYKSHQHANKENLPQLAQPYHQQLRYYVEGVRQLWPGRKVRAMLLFTACAELLELELES